MHNQPSGRDNLMDHEQAIYDEVLQIASQTGRGTMDVLLERCTDDYHGARVAEVLGGPGAFWDFRARYTERQLAQPENQRADCELVRDMQNGRIGVVRAEHDGTYLIEFANGTEVMAACDTQAVGPDPDVLDRAQQARQYAECARRSTENARSPEGAAYWRSEAEKADQRAAELDASSMDWLADPGAVYGFQGPAPADQPATNDPTAAAPAAEHGYEPAQPVTAQAVDADDDTDGV